MGNGRRGLAPKSYRLAWIAASVSSGSDRITA